MNLNDASDYVYNDDLEIVSDDNAAYDLLIESKNRKLNLQNKSINYGYKYSIFHNGCKDKGLKYISKYPENKEGVGININNNMSFIYINNYTTLEVLHKYNIDETFPIVIYDPILNEDGFFERQIYGFE